MFKGVKQSSYCNPCMIKPIEKPMIMFDIGKKMLDKQTIKYTIQ